MSAGRARLPPGQLLGTHRVADIPEEDALDDLFIRVAAIAGSILERRDHEIVVEIDLAGGCGRRTGDEFDHLRICGVGHIDDAPSIGYKVAHVEIPVIAYMLDRHLEGL